LLSALLHTLASSSTLLGWADMSGGGGGGDDGSGGSGGPSSSSSSSHYPHHFQQQQQQQLLLQQQQSERVWASLLILEALHCICADPVLLFTLFKVPCKRKRMQVLVVCFLLSMTTVVVLPAAVTISVDEREREWHRQIQIAQIISAFHHYHHHHRSSFFFPLSTTC
jgi:hypothetical protein